MKLPAVAEHDPMEANDDTLDGVERCDATDDNRCCYSRY